MGYLHLELWADDHASRTFSKRGDLYFSDCFFISGPTQGGPWELSATQVEEAGQEVVKVSAGDMVLREGPAHRAVRSGLGRRVVVAADAHGAVLVRGLARVAGRTRRSVSRLVSA